MKLERLWLYISLFLLLVLGFGLLNFTIFLELKRLEEEHLYRLAYQSFLIYLNSKEHRWDENIVINPTHEGSYVVYVFEDPTESFKSVRVGIRKEYVYERINNFMKKLLLMEFFLVFALVLLYQAVVEGYIRKLRDKEEWTKSLMLALTHRLGNFLSTQKVLIALLKRSYPEDVNLERIEKSVIKAQRDFSIFANLVRESRSLEKAFLDIKEFVEETLKYFEEEVKRKKVILNIKTMYVFMDKTDLEDVLYNLIGNAIKHSKSVIHIKNCPKRSLLIVKNDVSSKEGHGMGLGLELTRKVIERYGFSLSFRIRRDYTVYVKFSKG